MFADLDMPDISEFMREMRSDIVIGIAPGQEAFASAALDALTSQDADIGLRQVSISWRSAPPPPPPITQYTPVYMPTIPPGPGAVGGAPAPPTHPLQIEVEKLRAEVAQLRALLAARDRDAHTRNTQ